MPRVDLLLDVQELVGGARGWAAARMKRGDGVGAEGGNDATLLSAVGNWPSGALGNAKWPA